MINFLFGLLTKPTYQLTFLEQVIVSIVYIAIIFIIVLLAATIRGLIEDIVDKRGEINGRITKIRRIK